MTLTWGCPLSLFFFFLVCTRFVLFYIFTFGLVHFISCCFYFFHIMISFRKFSPTGFHYHPCGGSCVLYQRDSLSKNVQSCCYPCFIYWPVSFCYSVSLIYLRYDRTQFWSPFLLHYLFLRVVCCAVIAVLVALVASSPTMGWSGRSLSLLDP